MALSTASDYKTAIFKILYTSKAVSVEEWVRAGIVRADAVQLLSEYNTYRLALTNGVNQTKTTTAHA
jgi:hypothetical protein